MDNMNLLHSTRRTAAALVLAVVPPLCVFAASTSSNSTYLPVGVAPYFMAAVLLAWSPLPTSIPAVVLGAARDNFEPGGRGMARGWRMLKGLGRKNSPVQVEFLASIVGFAGACLLAAIRLAL